MNYPSSSSPENGSPSANLDAVSRRAYEIWEAEGRPEGDDMKHWLQAERELSAAGQGKAAETTTAAATAPQAATARDNNRRDSAPPFAGEKNRLATNSGAANVRRKPPVAPTR